MLWSLIKIEISFKWEMTIKSHVCDYRTEMKSHVCHYRKSVAQLKIF